MLATKHEAEQQAECDRAFAHNHAGAPFLWYVPKRGNKQGHITDGVGHEQKQNERLEKALTHLHSHL